jgi:hypothetical protein
MLSRGKSKKITSWQKYEKFVGLIAPTNDDLTPGHARVSPEMRL